MEKQAVRKKATIWDKEGKEKHYPSINLAKKASVNLQRAGKGLGRGDLRVVK